MTGEITLRGRVWPIAGLKEKLLAALRGGIKTVLIREENAKDLVEISESIKSGLEIVPVSHGRGARPRDDAQAGADRVGRDSGPANTRCSVCRFEPAVFMCSSAQGARNGFAEPRDREAKSTLSRPQPAAETARPTFELAETPANCGLFVRDRETSVRIGLRSGPGRIRTSNQTVMSGRL